MQSAGKGGRYAFAFLESLGRFVDDLRIRHPRYLNVPDMLEKKIRDLTTRILELEQALSSSHAQHTQTPHPLLKHEHLAMMAIEEDEDIVDEPLDMREDYVFKDKDLNSPKWIMASRRPISC